MTPDSDPLLPTQLPGDPLAGLDPREALAAGMQPISWEPPQPSELASVLPEYEVSEIIGRGGMGVIYKARDIQLDRMVAIKLLPPELSSRVDLVERFTREARALARLDHHHIVKVHDFSRTTAGHLYFVMEYVEGLDLSRIMRARQEGNPPKDHQATLEIIGQICDALHYAHSKGIVHRDIKPANVLITKEGQVKVADFGLARATEPVDGITSMRDPENMTLSGMIMGTLEYMAPEQREGMRVDRRADIYAVGVLFYQMLTGHLPRGAFLPPSRRTTGVDPRLDKVVLKALQTEPDQRYQRASEVRDAVQALQKLKAPPPQRPVFHHSEKPPLGTALGARLSRLFSLLPLLRPRKPVPVMGGGVILALCAVLGFYWWKNHGAITGQFPSSITIQEALPKGLLVRDRAFERSVPANGVLPLEGFFLPQSEPLALTFYAPGYQSRTLLVDRGSELEPQKILLEPNWTGVTWTAEPAGWFSALRLTRLTPPEDPRLDAIQEVPAGGGRCLAGAFALSGVWGQATVPLGQQDLSGGSVALAAKWPLPLTKQWSGMMSLNPQSFLAGLTGPFRKAASSWDVKTAVPFTLTFQPGGQAELRILNARILQVALLALIGGSLPTAQWEDEAAVTNLFREEIRLPLSRPNLSHMGLGEWFSRLWKKQSTNATEEEVRSTIISDCREQAEFLSSVLKASEVQPWLTDPTQQNLAALFFDTVKLAAVPGDEDSLRLENREIQLSLTLDWSTGRADFMPRSRIPVPLKPR